MEHYTVSPPTDDQIDQLILDAAVSGRLSPAGLDMLVNYVRVMRDKADQREQYIILKDQIGKFH